MGKRRKRDRQSELPGGGTPPAGMTPPPDRITVDGRNYSRITDDDGPPHEMRYVKLDEAGRPDTGDTAAPPPGTGDTRADGTMRVSDLGEATVSFDVKLADNDPETRDRLELLLGQSSGDMFPQSLRPNPARHALDLIREAWENAHNLSVRDRMQRAAQGDVSIPDGLDHAFLSAIAVGYVAGLSVHDPDAAGWALYIVGHTGRASVLRLDEIRAVISHEVRPESAFTLTITA